MAKIFLEYSILNQVNKFASDEETRYYLRGVYFEKNAVLVATNGHLMVVAHTGKHKSGAIVRGDYEPFIMPSEKIIAAKPKEKKSQTSWALIDTEAKTITSCAFSFKITEDTLDDLELYMKNEGITISYKPIDGTYPNYKRVIESARKEHDEVKAQPDLKYGMSAKYIGMFAIFRDSACTLFCMSGHSHSPQVVRTRTENWEIFGLFMPMRYDGNEQTFPDWLELSDQGVERGGDQGAD